MDYSTDTLINGEILTAIVLVIIGFFLFLAFYINFYIQFKKERDYIKMEIGRTYGKEHLYWKRRLKMLYISQIPIIRRFFK